MRRGVARMIRVQLDNNDCPCLRCMYLVQVTRINEKPDGSHDLRINCGISGCPEGVAIKDRRTVKFENSHVHRKIFDCIEMLERCIRQKSNGGK